MMNMPNVLNVPATMYPSSWPSEGIAVPLSTRDYFQSWEALPESGSLAYPRLNDLAGQTIRQDTVNALDQRGNALFLLRSSWALMTSAERRWAEMSDAYSVPGSPDITLRLFDNNHRRVVLDDRKGRFLDVSQASPQSDLIVKTGWQTSDYHASIEQQTNISMRGEITLSYLMNFDDAIFPSLCRLLGLDEGADPQWMLMRLAAMIERSGQYAAGALGAHLVAREITSSGYRGMEETIRIGFRNHADASVALGIRSMFSGNSDEVQQTQVYGKRISVQIAPTAPNAPFPLQPVLLEKLWNPIYARVLTEAFGSPIEA